MPTRGAIGAILGTLGDGMSCSSVGLCDFLGMPVDGASVWLGFFIAAVLFAFALIVLRRQPSFWRACAIAGGSLFLIVTISTHSAAYKASSCSGQRLAALDRAVRSGAHSAAAADAWMNACPGAPITRHTLRDYLQALWHPGLPTGSSCARMLRVGTAGDGGKVLCDEANLATAMGTKRLPATVQRHHGPPCHVVSVGSNGEASFERAVHGLAPRCVIHTLDGTLSTQQRANVPKFVDFIPHNFYPQTARALLQPALKGHPVSVLKIDCEGCELRVLVPFVASVCVEQIVVEVHGCIMKETSPREALTNVHALMVGLAQHNYTVFYSEFNLAGSDGTCVEFSLRRATPCAARQPTRQRGRHEHRALPQ